MARARRSLRSVAATAAQPQIVRCAPYCRVSTDAQADKEFNSVEAQQESCEAYISLHRDEGWTVASEPYLDAGFSGSNTKRPGLQRLIAGIEAGEIDVVVVYKYDRLSRSMLDFLKLLDFFKHHGVSFVSVSQRFDTSTPVGEMTLNVLLSFAQFERQIIAERTRDKIHACRRRGRWTGGRPVLGYDTAPEGGKLVINKDEAQQVRAIFEMFVEHPSLTAIVQELIRRGWRQKKWTTKGGRQAGGGEWNKASLRTLLANPLYIGKQKLRGEVFPGEHKGIITKKLFDAVQRIIQGNRRDGGASARNSHGFLLRGLIRCTACDAPMTADTPQSHGRRYRYYRCLNAQKKGHASCPTKSIPADRIEKLIVDEIRRIVASSELQDETFRQAMGQVKAQRRGLKTEKKRLARDLAPLRSDVERLVKTLASTDGPAADAVRAELAKAQERIGVMEARDVEVQAEIAARDAQVVDREDLDKTLEAFDPLWDVLLTPEKERILQLLIDRIEYNGESQEMTIAWRLGGFGELAKEVTP